MRGLAVATLALLSASLAAAQLAPPAVLVQAGGNWIRSSTTFAIYWQPAYCPSGPQSCLGGSRNNTKYYLSACALCPSAGNLCVAYQSPTDAYINSLFNGPAFGCGSLPWQLTGYMAGAPVPRLGVDAANSGR